MKKRHAEQGKDEEALDDTYLLMKMYAVFCADQCEGMPPLPADREHVPQERAEEIAAGYIGPTINYGGNRAAYSPQLDFVAMPTPEKFESGDAFYSTLFHELIHSTGHESRLARLESSGFGTGPYAKEELVAEMGAAMLCGLAGIENLDQSAAYLAGWLKPLRENSKFVVQAAAQAQKASDLILGQTFAADFQEPENAEAVAA